jgi:hypothetical protein
MTVGINALSITTFSIMTFSKKTCSITTLGIITFSIITFSIKGLFMTAYIYDTQHNNITIMLSADFYLLINVVMQNVTMLSVIVLIFVAPSFKVNKITG